jgi:hypothetical protein
VKGVLQRALCWGLTSLEIFATVLIINMNYLLPQITTGNRIYCGSVFGAFVDAENDLLRQYIMSF